MRRIAKAFAVFIPLFLGVACSDECKGPEDCAPGELCIRKAEANGDPGAAACVASANPNLVCITDQDCNNGSASFRCIAQRSVLRTATTSPDAGMLDASAPDATMIFPDASVTMTPCDIYCDNVQLNCVGSNPTMNLPNAESPALNARDINRRNPIPTMRAKERSRSTAKFRSPRPGNRRTPQTEFSAA